MQSNQISHGWTILFLGLLIYFFSSCAFAVTPQVAAGETHNCVLDGNGAVMCWGGNYNGQLGDGTTIDKVTPVAVTGLSSGVVGVAAGGYHSCALSSDGAVKCWGDNSYGQLGDGASTDKTTPVQVTGLSSGVVAIAAGWMHSCALTSGGVVKCWGDNGGGQLGDGTYATPTTPVEVTGLDSGVIAITTGFEHSCALSSRGAVKCWGKRYGSTAVAILGLESGVAAVSAGGDHSCALTSGGALKCWGDNNYGQLGDGTNISTNTPVQVTGLESGVMAIAAANNHTCAVTSGGAVKCWGNNDSGQLGDGANDNKNTPVPVTGLDSGVVAIFASTTSRFIYDFVYNPDRSHTCALTGSGVVKCWGYNGDGQLGDGTNIKKTSPVVVFGLDSGVSAVAAGDSHSCAVTSGGALKCWGAEYDTRPVAVTGLERGVASVAIGGDYATGFHYCIVTSSGAAKCWGANSYGQLGDGTTTSSGSPVSVIGLSSGVMALAAGDIYTCALISGGAVECWGEGYGSTPVTVTGLESGVTAIAAGEYHTCAVVGGAAKCWGMNSHGQLGDGTTTYSATPVAVVGLSSGVTAIAAGDLHTCAVSSGAAKCWGQNYYGQLGDGTNTNTTTPVSVTGLSGGVAAIIAGGAHSCALSTGGAVTCWGTNYSGLGGHDTRTTQTTPVAVTGLDSGVSTIAAGANHSCALISSGGAIKCWGYNYFGQLGNGEQGYSAIPVTTVLPPLTFNSHTLSLIATPDYMGAVSSDIAGIDCAPLCLSAFDAGGTVTLTAKPNIDYKFKGWDGACSGRAKRCQVLMDAAKTVSAIFTPKNNKRSMIVSIDDGGRVTGQGFNCGKKCRKAYPLGTIVTLTAQPKKYHTFSAWGGDCADAIGTTCTVAMDKTKNVSAHFY